jgi:hypothetical protein
MAAIPTHLRSVMNQDGAAILDTKLGTLTTLNETGAYIWQALERGEREEAIVMALTHATSESAKVIERDVRSFLVALAEQNLICAGDQESLSC